MKKSKLFVKTMIVAIMVLSALRSSAQGEWLNSFTPSWDFVVSMLLCFIAFGICGSAIRKTGHP